MQILPSSSCDANEHLSIGLGKILTVKELAPILQISEYTLRNLVRQNKIPSFRLGKEIRFYEEDIRKFIKKITR